MPQFCVFCGRVPQHKSLEHVVPRWLIELTGDPKRPAYIWPCWNPQEETVETKTFSFDQFGFPACDRCNNEFSDLEARTKPVIESLLGGLAISSRDFSTLLTWLDKVRIGLWLGFYYLQRTKPDMTPHMFIQGRLNRTDRLVLIYKCHDRSQRLHFAGANTIAFQNLPCCFSLVINDIVLQNVATDFIISKPLGLPYPMKAAWTSKYPEVEYEMAPGKERFSLPLLRIEVDFRGVLICQPMFTHSRMRGDPYYETSYARSMILDEATGTGKVFISKDGSMGEYPDNPTSLWEPTVRCDSGVVRRVAGVQTLRLQTYLTNRVPESGNLDPDMLDVAKELRRMAIAFNRKLIESMERG